MSARIGIVGGGVLGLTLGWRLAKLGHAVEIFEAAPELGGLATWHDYGAFIWDRFYHCILPTDRNLIGLIDDLELSKELVWRQTGTGYYAGAGRFFSMSKSSDYAKFPLLSWIQKGRIGATIAYATLAADPEKLYGVSAQDWLTRWCGRRGYEVFWRPLLRAKFGPFYDQVAAVFIWATLTRLFGARSGAASKEKLGYVRGGYCTILGRFETKLARAGASVHKRTRVVGVREIAGPGGGCELISERDGGTTHRTFDQVFFTGPTRAARSVVDPSLVPVIERAERENPASRVYLGVACLVMAVRRPLTPYYVLNVADESLELTGVIEMTNLVDPRETAGLSLVYVPKYMDSQDPRLDVEDGELERALMDRGVMKIFPDLRPSEVAYSRIHRTKFVQPLPLVQHRAPPPVATAGIARPFHILNTSMLRCATLNNDEVVAFVNRFVDERVGPWLGAPFAPAAVLPRDQVA